MSESASQVPNISVLCAHPISSTYDFNHRFVYYTAVAIILLGPYHRWITPAAFSFTWLYCVFSALYVIALSIAPQRLGPTLDTFALNSLLAVNTYVIWAAVFCRGSTFIKDKRGWFTGVRLIAWLPLWFGFLPSNFVLSKFQNAARTATVEVQCFAENASSAPANIFSIGNGVVCEDPCQTPARSATHRLQEQLGPIMWGAVDASTKEFTKMSVPSLSMTGGVVIGLFAVASFSTLLVNFFTSIQMTRNTIFAALTSGKSDSRVRVFLAKVASLVWYTWSYFTLLLVAIAVPAVSYNREVFLSRYPVTQTACAMALAKQWLPWVVAVAVSLVVVALWREHSEHEAWLHDIDAKVRKMETIQKEIRLSLSEYAGTESSPNEEPASSEPANAAEKSSPCCKKVRVEVAETRKINGCLDVLCELKEWWINPSGVNQEALPSADEEKALLKEHLEED